jgi:hypothetical protein
VAFAARPLHPGKLIEIASPLASYSPGRYLERMLQGVGYGSARRPDSSRAARYGEAVRGGACVLSVFTRSEEEKQYVEQLLLRYRAHQTTTPP